MSELIFNNAIFSEVEGKIDNAFKGNYDKEYEDGYAYANDRSRNDQPMKDGRGTIAISWSENAWNEVVNKNREAFAQMTKEEIDNAYQWFEGGFQYGMIAGSKLHTNSRKAPHGTKAIKSSNGNAKEEFNEDTLCDFVESEGLGYSLDNFSCYGDSDFVQFDFDYEALNQDDADDLLRNFEEQIEAHFDCTVYIDQDDYPFDENEEDVDYYSDDTKTVHYSGHINGNE